MFRCEAKIIQDYAAGGQPGQLVPIARRPRADWTSARRSPSCADARRATADDTLCLQRDEQQPADAQFQMPFERMGGRPRADRDRGGVQPKTRCRGLAPSAAIFVRSHEARRALLARSAADQQPPQLIATSFSTATICGSIDDGTELGNSLRLGLLGDYGSFVSNLQETVEPVLAAQRERESILRALADMMEVRDGKRGPLPGQNVLLLGVPEGALAAANSAADDEASAEADQPAAPVNAAADDPTRHFTQIDQHRIFIRTLRDLLVNSRLKVKTSLAAGQSAADFACVVVVGEPAGTSMDALRKSAGLVIDARNHEFCRDRQDTAS
jgi:hypothetical protein